MTSEFKKYKSGNETRYTLESMTAGGTGVGSIATSATNSKKSGSNLLTPVEGAEKKANPAKPRNFVAKNAKMGGAGQHKDKKKAAKQGDVKHKKPLAEDHEIQMAGSELQSIAKDAVKLLQLIKRYSEMEGLDAWQQSKITKAADYLNAVHQSTSGEQGGVAEVAPPGWEKTVKAMKKHDEIDNPFALAWSMKNKGYKSHKKESVDSYLEALAEKLDDLKKKM